MRASASAWPSPPWWCGSCAVIRCQFMTDRYIVYWNEGLSALVPNCRNTIVSFRNSAPDENKKEIHCIRWTTENSNCGM